MADKPTPVPGISDAFASRTDVLRVIRSPLSFFVLALLIIEIFLILAGTLFNLPLGMRIGVLTAGVLLFILVIGCVYRLVVKYPTHLVFSETSHVASLAMRLYGDDAHPLMSRLMLGVPPPEPPTGQLPPSTTTEGS
jgi:type III secretory pathway component EscU